MATSTKTGLDMDLPLPEQILIVRPRACKLAKKKVVVICWYCKVARKDLRAGSKCPLSPWKTHLFANRSYALKRKP